ncbi:ABC transporter permease [Vallitalea guaymasensis]|uniref:ABC transporter permease n=1 Tax=Vallitalea guaymasensis TaxID=1185412 RepID=UPI000DE3798C|nr:ABC transporter permease [Vallitalea guaymasensis]
MKTTTKIAVNNLKNNRTRSILISVAIVLTSCLLMIIGTSAFGLVKYNKANAGQQNGFYEGTYIRVKIDTLEKMKHHADFINIGISEDLATIKMNDISGGLIYMDNNVCDMINIVLEEGHLPIEENEIVGQKEFFESISGTSSIGNTVTIPYRVKGEGKIIEKDFIISGILPSNKTSNYNKRYQSLVSEDFYNSSISDENKSCNVIFNVLGIDELNYEQMQDKIKSLAETLGIDDNSVIINKGYLMWMTNPSSDIILMSALIGILVILFSALVIYNIFYVGIIDKVQEFGKIRAIGTTKKQLKQIILREGMILGLISIPIGIVLGYIIADVGFEFMIFKLMDQVVTYDIEKLSLFNIPVILLVILVSFITIYISLKKPMKIASNISPVEAIRYHDNTSGKIIKRKGYKTVNLYRLTMSDITRNKKRTLATIMTMGLSCVLFVTVANIASSMNPEYAAKREMEKGDYHIELEYDVDDTAYPENNLNHLQQQNIMGNDLIEEIETIDGISKIETRGTVLAKLISDNSSEDERLMGINVLSREDYEARIKECKKGVMDYDKAVSENGIAYTYDYFFEQYGYEIGDELTFEFYDGDRVIKFEAVLQASTNSTDTTFIMTEDTFKKLGFKENIISHIFIYCDKDKVKSVGNRIDNIASRSEYYSMKAYTELLDQSRFSIRLLVVPVYGLLIVLGIIGFMNMANTLITSIITRRREFGILQAIGLTNKQLGKMLQAEGLVFTIGTLIIALTVGNFFGYQLFLGAKRTGMIGISTYHFPFKELLIMTISLLAMQSLLSIYMSRYIQNDALIDRIRYNS